MNRVGREQCLVSVPSPATPGVLLGACDSPRWKKRAKLLRKGIT